MATFTSKLVQKEQVADGTMAFYFEKPEGFEYTAGQHISVRITNPQEIDEEGNERTLSLITAPFEPTLGVATRMRDTAFKKNLANAQDGMAVEVIDPRGSMVLPKVANRPLAFISGGIGITPFIGMLRQATHEKSEQEIYLFYANRNVAGAPFLDELYQLAKENPHFTFIPTMTKMDKESDGWEGETGYIDASMIQKYLKDIPNTIFYLAGPAGMVNGAVETLNTLNVDPIFVKSEDFGEYK